MSNQQSDLPSSPGSFMTVKRIEILGLKERKNKNASFAEASLFY
jgi:hypothetical protein